MRASVACPTAEKKSRGQALLALIRETKKLGRAMLALLQGRGWLRDHVPVDDDSLLAVGVGDDAVAGLIHRERREHLATGIHDRAVDADRRRRAGAREPRASTVDERDVYAQR